MDSTTAFVTRLITQFVKDEQGVTAIEYALLASLILIAALVAISNMTGAMEVVYAIWSAAVNGALASNP